MGMKLIGGIIWGIDSLKDHIYLRYELGRTYLLSTNDNYWTNYFYFFFTREEFPLNYQLNEVTSLIDGDSREFPDFSC